MKKTRRPAAAAAITGGMLLAIYGIKGLFPFGENSAAWCDMTQQVIPLLGCLKDILAGDGSLFLNLQNAGGMNFWGVFLFFLSSPFSFLTAFVEKADLMKLANILVLLKMMTAAASANVYFERAVPRLRGGFGMILSVSYAFCGYTMLFYQNVVWLDEMILFPLLLLGFRHLMENGSILPYAFCLAAMVVVHFHLGYMVVLFLIFASFFWVGFFAPRKIRGQRALQLAVGTAGAGLLSAAAWLPALLQYFRSARGGDLLENLAKGKFLSPLPTIGMMLIGTAVLLPAFLLQLSRAAKGRSLHREESWTLWLFGLLLVAMVVEPVNKLWHTGSYQAFPGRYGYMAVLMGLTLAAQLLRRERREIPASKATVWGPVLAALFLAAASGAGLWLGLRRMEELSVYTRTLWGNNQSLRLFLFFFLPAALCGGLVLLFYRRRVMGYRLAVLMLGLLVAVESLFYGNIFFLSRSDHGYTLVAGLEDVLDDESFYRLKNRRKDYDVNLTGAMGYNTLNHYTSLTRRDYMQGVRKLGYSSYWMEVSSVGGTLMSDAILNHKYTVSYQQAATKNTVYQDEDFTIDRNPYVLPLGIVSSGGFSDLYSPEVGPRPELAQTLLAALSGSRRQLVRAYEPTMLYNVSLTYDGDYCNLAREGKGDSIIEYRIPASAEQKTFYFDCFDSLENNLREPYYQAFSVYVDGQLVEGQYPSQRNNGVLELGVRAGAEIRVSLAVHRDVSVRSFGVYSVSHTAMDAHLSSIRTAQLEMGKDRITGTAEAKDDGETLFLSLPYDEGYTARVNGEKVQIQKVFDCWMAIPLAEGQNQIEIRYHVPGFWPGMLLSLVGLGAILVAGRWMGPKGRRFRRLEKPAWAALMLLGVGMMVFIYLFPVAVYMLK